jgi:O-antigen ligase
MLTPPDIEFRAWHSAYVQMAAEHGLVGLVFFGTLMLGTIISLSRLIGRARRRADPFLADQASALRASLMAYLVGAAFLSIAYWELLYLLVAAALVLKYQSRLPKKH